MASAPVRTPATYADILALPRHVNGQIVDGELFATPRPANPHAMASSTLGMDLGAAFQRGRGGPGGWWIVDEPELHLGRNILIPDLAGWRRSRLPAIPAEAFFTLAPDWICEILSPSTASFDRVKKMRVFAAEGVGHAWLVDPAAQTLEVYRLEDEHWVLLSAHEGTETVRAEPFEELEIALRDLWIEPIEPAP
ncbi:MAG: Uma2 family endonuclease [Acidobacteria bacterium]|nr:Uma2 family endonuclease [Acidobacteriota bacterium]